MSKRLLCLLLSVVMILGIMPGVFASAAEEDTQTTAFVGKSEVTGGDWIGKFGAEGYMLPFYTLYEKYNPLVNAENPEWKIDSGRYRPVEGTANRTRYTLEDGVSLLSKPSYVTAIYEVATGDGYSLDAGYFEPGNDALAPQDPRDGATTRNKSYVRSSSYLAYKFVLNDDAWHYVTVYAQSYKWQCNATFSVIEGTSESATAAATYTAAKDDIKAGIYMTFKVKGSFVLRADKIDGDAVFVNGIFFDAVPGSDEPENPPAATDTTSFVGKAAFTGGNWIGKFGEDGYLLPFYTLYEKYNPLVNAENPEWKIDGGRYRPVEGTDNRTRYTLEEGVSLISKPSYVTSISEVATGDGYSLDSDLFMPGNDPLAPQDPRDGATTRNKSYVRTGSYLAYTFKLNDDAWHYVTVYAQSYKYQSNATYSVIEGTNRDATAAASCTASKEEIKAGTYMTFKVKGDFVLRVDKIDGDAAFLTGIYFDTVPTEAAVSNLKAEQSAAGVTLTWDYTGTEIITVQRRVTGTENWESIGNTPAGAVTFTDALVESGVSYDYRVAASNGALPSAFTDPVTIAVTVAVESAFAYVGKGSVIGGDWIGKVGSEGYFLPFYTIFGAYGEIASGRYDKNTTECTGWSLQDKSSLKMLGEGISIVAEAATNNGYYISDKDFRVTTDGRALQDPREGATTRNMTYVRSNPWLSYTVDMPEDETYYVTLYTTDFSGGISDGFDLLIMDTTGAVTLAQSQVTTADLGEGVYTTFKVTGDFMLKLQGTRYVFLNGIFFDKAPSWEVTDFAVENGDAARSAVLSWSCDTAVAIERKASDSDTWEQIAVVEAGVGSYTDANLNAGTTYTYRVAGTNKILFGAYSEEKSITTPSYAETVISAEAETYTVTVGEELKIAGTLKKKDGTALSGKSVQVTLAGVLVSEGFAEDDQGSVITDDNGAFEVVIADLPGGSYTVTFAFAADDEAMLMQSDKTVEAIVATRNWEEAPKLLTVSDGVAPGEYFSINGYGLNIGTPEVRIGTGDVETATVLTIAQYDETDGYFIQLQLPEAMAAGTYKIWVKNDNGWSDPILFNGARPLFISENSAWAGQIIEISGRNLLGSQYGAADASAVRLVGASGTYAQTIVENNPYKIAFAVKDAPEGDYTVEVTNDGVNWVALSSDQILSVVAVGNDPLGLGVAWADVYNWDNRISVLDHGATGDDTTDDTAAIKAAVDAAAVNGGVVYLPAGNYYVSRIEVPAHVVILGEGMDKTFLYYNGTDGKNMIESVGTGASVGYQGFACFTIRLADVNYQPDTYFWLGYAWGGDTLNNKYSRENKYYFLYEVGIDADPLVSGSNRGLGMVPIVGEHLLMQSCRFVGDMAIPSSGYVSAYASMKDCYLEFAQGVPQMNSSYTFVEDTDVIIHYETGLDSHGITVRDNSHVEDCYVYGAGSGDSNDGETILAEATSFYDYGQVVSVDGNKILVNGTKTTLSGFQLRWGELTIMITDGKGIGQYRFVDMTKFDWSNPSATEFYVTEPWDIEPDATSKYTLVCMIENVTFYRNKTEDGVKGIWFYGNVNDGVIAENTSINTEGIFAYSSQQKATSRHTVSYRTTIRDNELYGVARKSNRVGIYTHAQRGGVQGKYVAVSLYALDVKDNRIYGDATKTPVSMNETPRHSGIVISSCEISSDNNCLSELGQADTANVIVQGNQLFNLKEGILVTSCTYGTVISNNYFEDVETKLVKLSVDAAKEAQPLMLMSDITDAPQTQPPCEDHLWLEGEDCLECGWCDEKNAAQIGDEIYGSLAEALAAADNGDTVVLTVSQSAGEVVILGGVTLDLNGYALTADYMIAFEGCDVIDSVGGGLIKCKNVRLAKDNSAMPVWDEENGGYRLFSMFEQQVFKTSDANGFEFVAKPLLNSSNDNNYLMAQSETNGLSVKVRMSWQTTSGNLVEQLFVMKGEDVEYIYTTPGKVISLTVSGAGGYIGKLQVTAYIESETGVIWTGEDMVYTGE